MKRFFSYLLIPLTFLIVGIVLGISFTPPQILVKMIRPATVTPTITTTPVQSQTKEVSLLIDYGTQFKIFPHIAINETETVLQILQKIAGSNDIHVDTKEYAGIGTLVEQIGDKKNGTEQNYWQYWIGNEQPQVGADKYLVLDKDYILWRFTKSAYEAPDQTTSQTALPTATSTATPLLG